MINPRQLRDLIVKPTLAQMQPLQHDQAIVDGTAIVNLLMGTAMQESRCGEFLHQLGAGPALGVWQMEPATEKDCWVNYLDFHPQYRIPIGKLLAGGIDRTEQLVGNLYYACAMARIKYLRVPEAVPEDIERQAAYYVRYYNAGGAATVAEYMRNWTELQRLLA